ncbi:hypothetical protein MKX64_24085 [Paenibacillus sp. FSL M8-0334]|uniref:hypothetical protein n=1 Tax=Paenibacillus sp. FSL M8-0334 TaxID=2921623 RepID=UPI0030F728A2
MGRYRKKPEIIDAFMWTGDQDQKEDPQWIVEAINKGAVFVGVRAMLIKTPEGNRVAHPGDYIIKGVNGEIYTCKPDIFEKTYEEVIE